MIAAGALLVYATAGAFVAPALLRRLAFLRRHPRVGILVWQTVALSVLLAAVLAAVTLALPFLPLRFPLADIVGIPPVALVEHYSTRWDPWPGVLALGAALIVMCWLALRLILDARELASERRHQRERLLLVASVRNDGLIVVEHDEPVVYCLPGRLVGARRTVVASSGAVQLLTDQERRLVVAHEHRHLASRHHLVLAVAATLARTLRRVPMFAAAHDEIAVLVEMDADDAARSSTDRRRLATALVALGAGSRPEASLGAGDTAALARVHRLTVGAAPRLLLAHGFGAGLATAAVLAIPVTIAVAPAVETAVRDCFSLARIDT